MTLLKTVGVTVLAWGALGSSAGAAPLSWFGSSNVSAWYANQSFANGGFYAPAHSPTPVFAYSGWYNNPAYLASLGSPAPAPATTPAPAVLAAFSVPAEPAYTPAPARAVDAYINMSSGPFPESGSLTNGGAQPWYVSPSAVAAFGGTPDAAQQASFVQSVVANVQQTFQNSGLDISLTADANVAARHTLSVVSGTSFPSNPNAIGITTVGGDGFSFIDKLAYAGNPDQLAWAVAHNVAHELVHALGVGAHPDETGAYLDAATANWSMLVDPDAKFSPQAVELIRTAMSGSSLGSVVSLGLQELTGHGSVCDGTCKHRGGIEGAQVLEAPVPEPATIAVWSLSAVALVAIRRKAGRRAA
jgi:hypothetical protein